MARHRPPGALARQPKSNDRNIACKKQRQRARRSPNDTAYARWNAGEENSPANRRAQDNAGTERCRQLRRLVTATVLLFNYRS